MVKVEGFKAIESLDPKSDEVVVSYDPSKTKPEALAQAISAGTRFTTSVKPAADGAEASH